MIPSALEWAGGVTTDKSHDNDRENEMYDDEPTGPKRVDEVLPEVLDELRQAEINRLVAEDPFTDHDAPRDPWWPTDTGTEEK